MKKLDMVCCLRFSAGEEDGGDDWEGMLGFAIFWGSVLAMFDGGKEGCVG